MPRDKKERQGKPYVSLMNFVCPPVVTLSFSGPKLSKHW